MPRMNAGYVLLLVALIDACASVGSSTTSEKPISEQTQGSQLPPPEQGDETKSDTLDAESVGQENEATTTSPNTSTPDSTNSQAEGAPEQIDTSPNPTMSSNASARKDFEDAVYVAAAEPARAMALFERAARTDNRFIIAWHNAGVSAERQANMNAAVAYYHKALEQKADYFPSLYNIVQLYRRLNRGADAVKVANTAVGKKRNSSTLSALAAAYLATKQIAEAEKNAKLALKEDEKNVTAMLLLAETFEEQKKYELVRFVLNNALAIEPDNALVLQGLGRVYLNLKNKPAAIQNFVKAVEIRQDLSESYNNLAALYYETGDYTAAESNSKIAVSLDPKLGSAWINRGNALRAQKNYVAAIAAYQTASTLPFSKSEALYNLGILYLDNEVEKADIVDRLTTAIKYLQDYKSQTRLTEDDLIKLDDYLTQAEREKDREIKRRDRDLKRKVAAEQKQKAEAEAKKKAEEEAQIKAEQEAKKKADDEAKAKAALEAKAKAENEAKIRAEEEAKRKAEIEAQKKAAEEAARNRKIGGGEK